MNKGKIIFLNGASSSGKTTIAKRLQEICEEPFLHLSIDNFLDMLPDNYINGENSVMKKELLNNLLLGMHHSIASFSSIGCNLIVDHVFSYKKWLFEYFNLLKGFPVYLVGIHCPLDELVKREQKRGDREIGLAMSQFDSVHVHGFYDINVNTHLNDPNECASLIKEYIKAHEPDAFNKLLSKLESY